MIAFFPLTMTIKNILCCEKSEKATVYKGYPKIKDTKGMGVEGKSPL
jgi:hypothetical protein